MELRIRIDTPKERIFTLRSQGLSVKAIAKETGTTVGVVRGIVGKLDPTEAEERRKRQYATATRIDAMPLTFSEKAELWTAETGQSEATYWRVLQRTKGRQP